MLLCGSLWWHWGKNNTPQFTIDYCLQMTLVFILYVLITISIYYFYFLDIWLIFKSYFLRLCTKHLVLLLFQPIYDSSAIIHSLSLLYQKKTVSLGAFIFIECISFLLCWSQIIFMTMCVESALTAFSS